MSESRFDLEDVKFTVMAPEPSMVWNGIQRLRYDAFSATLPGRSPEEIAHLTQQDDSLAYFQSCLDPTASDRLFSGQSFDNLTMTTAHIGNELVGYGYAADNVSGRIGVERWVKMHMESRRYAWLREIVVTPSMQRRGIGTAIGMVLLDRFEARQPVSAYTWEENEAGTRLAKSLGLRPDVDANGVLNGVSVQAFGEDVEAASQVRWSGITVGGVSEHVLQQPGASDAFKSVWPATRAHGCRE